MMIFESAGAVEWEKKRLTKRIIARTKNDWMPKKPRHSSKRSLY